MAMPNAKGWLAVLFIGLCLAIPFVITYYVSTQGFQSRYQDWQRKNREAGVPSKSEVTVEKVVLMRDDRVQVGNTALVFKGVEKKQICLDLYLLELDAGYPYPQKFPLDDKKRAIRFGDVTYSLKSVNNRVLILNILRMMQTE